MRIVISITNTTLAYLRATGLTITDACGDAGLTVTSSDGSASGTCPIPLTRTYTVTDACGNATTATQTITIDDTQAPAITGTLAAIATEGCGIVFTLDQHYSGIPSCNRFNYHRCLRRWRSDSYQQ